ncbi:MAG: hypothetical protein M3O29_04485, partial [Actinomycetota bacterium]|nr:hypothetical protein [Actinomycetota bacterium]
MSWSRARVVTLVVCALVTVACGGSTLEAALSSVVSPAPSARPSTHPSPTPTRSSYPSPSPTGPKKHSYVTVDDIQAVSPETAIVTYE